MPEEALAFLLLVDDRDELEVAASQRHDPVRGAPTGMATSLVGGQPVRARDCVPRSRDPRPRSRRGRSPRPDSIQSAAGYCEADAPAPAPTASSDAWKSVLSIFPW